MKLWKTVCFGLMGTFFILFFSSCASSSSIIPDGKWESTSPEMFIEFGAGGGTAVSGVNGLNNHTGELVDETSSVVPITFRYVHGNFSIFLYSADGIYDSETVIYEGNYELKEDTLTLHLKDGGEIIMKKVNEL